MLREADVLELAAENLTPTDFACGFQPCHDVEARPAGARQRFKPFRP